MSKSFRLHVLLLSTFVLLAALPTGCSLDHAPVPTNCLLTRSVTRTIANDPYPASATWTYSANGQLTESSTLAVKSTLTRQYSYDSNGYVTSVINLGNNIPFNKESYEYVAGRLVKETVTDVNTSNVVGTTTYEYDQAGNPTRIVVSSPGESITQTYLFANGKQTDYIYDTPANPNYQPYRFENGLIKEYARSSGNSTQTTYAYDNQGRRTRADYVEINGVAHYVLYEYTSGKLATEVLPQFKGWPQVASNSTGDTRGVLAKATTFGQAKPGDSFYKIAEQTYAYSRNTSGYPISSQVIERTFNASGGVLRETTFEANSYTYTNCQ